MAAMKEINIMKILSGLAAFLLAVVSVRADVTLNAIFDDHMVLQRDIPVWRISVLNLFRISGMGLGISL